MSEKGVLLKEKKDSTPPGVLNADQCERFKTIQENIAELPIESIQPYLLIPDYREPTESTLPIIVHSPQAFYCIDGWNLIEKARTAGHSKIRSYILYIQEHSDTELAIRKVAIRTRPQGGICSCAEFVRNANLLAQILMNEMENPIVFSHGGARQGASFTDNKEDDLREVLSKRLGKERSTINDYLNFRRHLTDDAIDVLVAQKAGKAFFEKARVNKRRLIKDLESDGKAYEEITTEVSRKMLEWFAEYQETGDIRPELGESVQTEEDIEVVDQGGETTADAIVTSTGEVDTFHHRSPPTEIEAPELPTEESVKTEIQVIIEALNELMGQSPLDCEQGIEIIRDQINQLVLVQQRLIDIRSRAQQDQDKEVI